MPSDITPIAPVETQLSKTEMPTAEVTPSMSPTSVRKSTTLANTPSRHIPVTDSPYVSPTVTVALVTPDLVATPVAVDQFAAATPVAVDQFAAATLTAVAPGGRLSTSTQKPVIVTVSPSLDLTPTPGFRYVFPIQPPEVANYSAGHHDYPATDIFAPHHSLFVAVTDGIIDELSRVDRWNSATNDPALRGGRYVSLIGDDGVRYYGSHLDEVVDGLEAGMRVTAGTGLGYVGNSGNARGIAPHLHFGISRPTFPGDWQVRRGTISPYPYLQAWARGENLAPEIH